MPVLTMAAIDVLREQANLLIEKRRKLEKERDESYCNCGDDSVELWETKEALAVLEAQIDAALSARQRLPACAFCQGRMLPTPTVGRLECERCRALLLRGRA